MKRDSLVWGVILILLGVGFLVSQLFPSLFGGFGWPWILVVIGAVFFVASLVGRVGGLMVPAAILLGLSGIFIYQTRTGDWGSWAYIWALIPGFAGLGMVLGSLFDREMAGARGVGLVMLTVSLIVFAVLGGFFGLDPSILRFWPVLLILLGAYVFLRAMLPARKE